MARPFNSEMTLRACEGSGSLGGFSAMWIGQTPKGGHRAYNLSLIVRVWTNSAASYSMQ
jgi:hypothetical protein